MKLYRESNFNRIIVITIITLVCSTSCKKFVEVGPPVTQLVTTSVFNNNSTANAAQTAIYSQMEGKESLPYLMALYTGLSSDELKNYSTSSDLGQFYSNSLISTNSELVNLWSPIYNYIYQANAIIEGLSKSTGVSPQVKQQLIGESKFIRAFWHFYLVNLFGDVPLVTSTNYKINSLATRSPKELVYAQIIADLIDAQKLLNTNYVGADGITTTDEKVRPNRWVATALLARVYLFTHDYANAEIQATSLINNLDFSLNTDLNDVFLANSTEAIWQLMIPLPNNTLNTVEGRDFILNSIPQDNIYNCTTISDQLINSFEPGDSRFANWISAFPSGSTLYYFPYKYKVYSSSTVTEYSMVFRLAEQFLIRAEARVNLEENNAVNDLNVIRNRSGLSNYSGSLDRASLLAAIYHEREVEFFTEWGHRWIDLKRSGGIDAVMITAASLKGGHWNSSSQLYPLPQAEITKDPNLKQNQGY
ncbi:RagB/SusD family nutrient uptake outer membrane protein [Mucilaginibacter sp. Mucisp84]|uniref:RagB/SusD family nutrient uptake outer membrane protein n=1 Tax=Mucilaginibacter sp. Mucisp84 TaxID=3243058 RepID=UPI0039A41670